MISKVEYGQYQKEGEPALSIVFTYDEEYTDAYEIWGEANVNRVFGCVALQPTPEALLIELRHMTGLTVH